METQKTSEVLNTLIEINNDRIEAYETASTETKEVDLKLLFSQFIQTSNHCKSELVKEVHHLGYAILEGTRLSGKFFRVWMDVKAALTGNNTKLILDSCEYGEDMALTAYDDVLKNSVDFITPHQQSFILAQKILLQADHDRLKNLRDALEENE